MQEENEQTSLLREVHQRRQCIDLFFRYNPVHTTILSLSLVTTSFVQERTHIPILLSQCY